jgi:hypothetical protein
MSDPRDDLTALIYHVFGPQQDYDAPSNDDLALDAADAILARWRLVPVEETRHTRVMVWVRNQEPTNICNACGADWPCETAAEEQNRAADELTHHDQAAGHYDELPPIDMHPLIGKLRSDVANGTACACGRTDQHGPHKD